MSQKFEHIKGCFLGLAIGDALGVPVEFKDRSQLMLSPVRDMIGYGTWNQPPGTWSDDSSLTFCLAESLVNGYNPENIGEKFVAWYSRGYWGAHNRLFDIGLTTRTSIVRIKNGEDPRYSGELAEDCNGNGSLMRIVPASLYFCNEADQQLYNSIKEVSSMTHGHFISIFSCYIFSKFVIELFNGRKKQDALKKTCTDVSLFAKQNQFNASVLKSFDRILSGKILKLGEGEIQSSGFVRHTLEAALWSFMTTDNYSNAVLRAVNLGEDTDTTACVTGALAGLYYGDAEIPSHWIEQLARRNDILKLADDFTYSLKRRILHSNS